MSRAELNFAQATPRPFGIDPSSFSAVQTAKVQYLDGDYDVFGDGTVKILKTPGHTPGHQVLRLRLKKAGEVVLSGDLYHTRENRTRARVPVFNQNRADTLASINRVETVVRHDHARFVIQHSTEDFARLPRFPQYLD